MAEDVTDTPPASDPAPGPPSSPPLGTPVVVARWVQLVMLPLAVLALYALAHAAGPVLLLFIVAAVIALILNPLVALLQRARVPRTLAVIAVYLAFFTTLPFLGFLAAGPVSDQATSFANDVPSLVDNASALLDDVQEFFDDKGVDVQIKGEGDSALASLQDSIVTGSGEIVSLTGELLRLLIELSLLRDPRRRPLDLHAHLRPADRRPRALGDAAGRRHAGGRLPDARAEGGVRLRARPAAVQRDHGRLGGHRAVDLRRPGDLPRRAHVRLRLRPVLRASWSSCPTSGPCSARCRR